MSDIALKGAAVLVNWFNERKIKGKRVSLIVNSTRYYSPGQAYPTIVTEVLEGEVEEIFPNPPGLALKDVFRYFRTETTEVASPLRLEPSGERTTNVNLVEDVKSTQRVSPHQPLKPLVQLMSAIERGVRNNKREKIK